MSAASSMSGGIGFLFIKEDSTRKGGRRPPPPAIFSTPFSPAMPQPSGPALRVQGPRSVMMTGSGAPALQRANSPWHVQPCLVAGPWAPKSPDSQNAPGRSSTGLPPTHQPRVLEPTARQPGAPPSRHLRRDARRFAHLTAALGLVSNRCAEM